MLPETVLVVADWKAGLDWLSAEFNRPFKLFISDSLRQEPWFNLWKRNSPMVSTKCSDRQSVFVVTSGALKASDAKLRSGEPCSVWIAVGRSAVSKELAVIPRILGGVKPAVQLERYDIDPGFWEQSAVLRDALGVVHTEEWECFFGDVFSTEHQQENVLYPKGGDPQWWLSFLQQCPVCLMKSHQGLVCVNNHYVCRACDARMADDSTRPDRAYACPMCRVEDTPTAFVPRPGATADEAPDDVALATRFLFGLLFHLNGLGPVPHCDWDFCLYPVLVEPGPGRCAILSLGRKTTTRLMHGCEWTAGFPRTTLVELQFKL